MLKRLVLLTAVLAAGAGPSSKPAAPRKSADGVALPDALPEKKLQGTLPLIGDKLGSRPEEIAPRVFSAEKSARTMARLVEGLEKDTEWFAPNAFGATVVGVRLTDGRVTHVRLVYHNIPAVKDKAIRGELTKASPGTDPGAREFNLTMGETPVTAYIWREGDGDVVTFDLDEVEWVLAYHPQPAEVTAAIRSHKVIKGMTEPQAVLAFAAQSLNDDHTGGPHTYVHRTTTESGDAKTVTWRVGHLIPVNVEQDVRIVTAAFRGGVVTDVRETRADQ